MKKRTTIRVITFLSAAVVVVGVLAWTNIRRARSLELYARAATQHAFDELVTSVSELSNDLEKCIYITDPALESALCTQMYGKAVTAQLAAGSLPYSSRELERTASFLSQVGDYACTLSRTVGGNGGYSREELENLTELADTASVMALNLRDMQARVADGSLALDEVYKAAGVSNTDTGGEGEAPLAGTVFESMEAEFPELPALIYDGPFSQSMESPSPVYLADREEVDRETARSVAAEFLNVKENAVAARGECGGTIPCWCFSAFANGGEYYLSVTKQGGEVLSALCARAAGEETLSVKDGLAVADRFMGRLDMDGMERSYHMAEGGILTVNYEYVQDGVICYPDLVKIGVALDNGAVVRYDARGYLSAHQERTLPEAAVSAGDARRTVPETLSVRSQGMAVIPSEGGEERFCHELVCQTEDKSRYIIYVNAETGAQEKILILLEDDAGTLTI